MIPSGSACLRIVADDLSGAADCAAAFARAWGPVPVTLGGSAEGSACQAVDTDSRSMDAREAQACVARVFGRIVGGDLSATLVYKKIDSTLRGHVGAELRAALAAAPGFAAAVVAPAFPEQGRTLVDGRLCLQGRPAGEEGDLPALLAAAGLPAALLRQPLPEPASIVRAIGAAVTQGARAVVVDAASGQDLARLAQALWPPPDTALLLVGSAGLARALAAQALAAHSAAAQAPARPHARGPVLALVGSFSRASAAQVQQVETAGDAQVIRLRASQWTAPAGADERRLALDDAAAALARGRNVLLAIAGEVTQPFSRALVQAMAAAAAPLLDRCAVCLLTGGDTARALFDEIGVRRLEVGGEFEPGISLASAAGAANPLFVLKAGGFGDDQALRRIMVGFGGGAPIVPARQAAPS